MNTRLIFEESPPETLKKWWMDFNDKGEVWYMAMIYKRLQLQGAEYLVDVFITLPRHCDNARQRFREMKELLPIVEL